jgi:hypothetical protein
VKVAASKLMSRGHLSTKAGAVSFTAWVAFLALREIMVVLKIQRQGSNKLNHLIEAPPYGRFCHLRIAPT